jgi:hypothetical protein
VGSPCDDNGDCDPGRVCNPSTHECEMP